MTDSVAFSSKHISFFTETLNYVVVDKPYDLCINGEKELSNHGQTLASLIAKQRPELIDKSVCSGFRFPHQLDYATSGAICITLNRKTTREVVKLFAERTVHKEYLALVHHHVKDDQLVVMSMIGKDSSDETGFAMTSDVKRYVKPKLAETRVKVIARGYYEGKPVSKLAIQPITGRRHQIRVHCRDIGHAILGDYTYSGKRDVQPYRMMLHSWKLKIPLQHDPIDVTSKDPFHVFQDVNGQLMLDSYNTL